RFGLGAFLAVVGDQAGKAPRESKDGRPLGQKGVLSRPEKAKGVSRQSEGNNARSPLLPIGHYTRKQSLFFASARTAIWSRSDSWLPIKPGRSCPGCIASERRLLTLRIHHALFWASR